MCKLVTVETNYGEKISVAETKKKYIENIMKSATKCKQIDEIILFGSSLESRCNVESDIDIAIISKSDISRLSRSKAFDEFMERIYAYDLNQEYDRIYFKSVQEIRDKMYNVPICNELIQKGKVIYRRATG